jgi:hypothetical protein
MNNNRFFSKIWLSAALLVTFVAGCGGGGGGGGVFDGAAKSPAKAITAYSLAGNAGTIDETAKTIAVTMPNGTNVTALVATFTTTGAVVKAGAVTQTSGTTTNDFTAPVAYTVTAADGTTANYTVTVALGGTSAKAITAFSLAGIAGTINESTGTIAVTVPNGTNLSALTATFSTTGAAVNVGSVVQTSGTTTNNFTAPLVYNVTAADGTKAAYTVTVTVASSSARAITAYSFAGFAGAAGLINETSKTIAVTVPNGTALTNLVATFTTSGTGVKVGSQTQTSGATSNSFTAPVVYTVTAADGSTANYTVTVTAASSSSKTISAFSLAGVAGTINDSARTIAVTLPGGTSTSALVATFITTGSGVKVGAQAQTSGATSNNFTAPVVYTVTAADGTTATYTVTVTVAASSSKTISAFSLAGVAGTINESARTIAVTMPGGTTISALVATFTTTGTGVKVGTQTQISGATSNNFTAPVVYTVTAADGTTAAYTVNVTVVASGPKGPATVNLGTAGNFVILSKTAVSTTGTTAVTGNIGISPAAASYITGFALTADSTNTFSISSIVTGRIYASNYAAPTPDNMTTAVSNMETAYTDAAGRTSPDFTEKGAGDISGLTLVPGLYKWGTGVLVTSSGVTLSGGANDVWIFQIAGDLTVNNSAIITLAGGAQAKNIFWQVSGQATLGTGAQFKGIILGKTLISLNTGAALNGRALAQTAVTLNAATITAP